MSDVQITVRQVSYDTRGASEAVGCGVTSIKEAIARGDLIAHYLGTKPLIRAIDLDAWVASLPTESPRERMWGRRG